MIAAILGGIGLFLLGMKLLTDGLQAFAGDALRGLLQRFTRTPLQGLATGAAVTAIVQSSSATTLAAIGFVGAGLLTFPQALTIVYGANVGTTTTAWIVSLVGLKVKLDAFALPFVGIGAGLKVLGRGRAVHVGTALAGFGLIFLGIEVLQGGMAGLAEHIDPASWALGGFTGRLALVVVGALMTVVLQSSSAAVTTTLAAVHAGTVTLEQAAALVIGQNVGTTVTAGIGAMGGTVATRRTALAHVLFNVVTGALALVVLPLFVRAISWADGFLGSDPAVALALFHTTFNLLGVAIFLPRTAAFAALVERLVPERGRPLTRRLADTGAGMPIVLLEAGRLTVIDVATAILTAAREALDGAYVPGRLEEARLALRATRDYLAPVATERATEDEFRRHLALLHAIDHLQQLGRACDDLAAEPLPAGALGSAEAELQSLLDAALDALSTEGAARGSPTPSEDLAARADELAARRHARRAELLEQVARGAVDPAVADRQLQALQWADQIATNVSRALHYARRAAR